MSGKKAAPGVENRLRFPAFEAAESWLLDAPRNLYASAMLRILLGVTILGSLAVNFGDRRYLWGSGSGWVEPYRENSPWNVVPFTFFSAADSDLVLTVKIGLLGLAAMAMTLGWYSTPATVAVLLLSTSLVSLGPTSVDAADNAFRIFLVYACFLDSGARWSLDNIRSRRRGAGGRWPLVHPPRWARTVIHNFAVVAVAGQVIAIYTVAGLSKFAGATWRDGTAVYYPLAMENFRPWPGLSDLMISNDALIHAASWGSVGLQCLFGLMLLWRPARIVAVLSMIAMHAAIGISMGLFIFSIAMMAGDVIFIRDGTVLRICDRAVRFVHSKWRPQRP